MVDVAFQPTGVALRPARRKSSLRAAMKHKSTMAFLMTLPLIVLIATMVIYPAGYSIYLATLNKSMTKFVGFGNFLFLFKRQTFWMVVEQSCIFAITAVIFKALIGFIVAHFAHNIPSNKQRKWRGMLLVPWVIPPAMSTLAWLWLFDPSYSAFNYTLGPFGTAPISWLGETDWARFSVILINVWYGAPFFLIMYLAALKSVPEQLYEAAPDRRRELVAAHLVRDAADDAQHHRHHGAVLDHRDVREFRHRTDAYRGRSDRQDACVRHMGVPVGH